MTCTRVSRGVSSTREFPHYRTLTIFIFYCLQSVSPDNRTVFSRKKKISNKIIRRNNNIVKKKKKPNFTDGLHVFFFFLELLNTSSRCRVGVRPIIIVVVFFLVFQCHDGYNSARFCNYQIPP